MQSIANIYWTFYTKEIKPKLLRCYQKVKQTEVADLTYRMTPTDHMSSDRL